jgi:hypothetical protein
MPHTFTATGPQVEEIDGRTYVYWTITERNVSAGAVDAWEIPVPTHFTLTLFEAAVVSGPAATLQPQLTVDAGWGPEATDAPAARVKNQTSARFTAPGRRLSGYSVPSAAAGQIVTRITYVSGHV